ncbi:MAG TPA: 4-hydroxybenzoate 3-monooxygenase [Casimicrobiaceae bacterium]|nr:4-hydroxybenzoate 3-monooxygenase [Casimicrobiaceae bacterium]
MTFIPSVSRNRTQVAIVGAGPAGLMLSHLLARERIDSVVFECRRRADVEATVRAGVLEQATMDLLIDTGVGERMLREGALHQGIEIRFDGHGHRIALSELTGGRAIALYAQHEVLRDLIAERLRVGGDIRFEVSDLTIHDFDSARPFVRYRTNGATEEMNCDFIVGCDGFHGVCRRSVRCGACTEYEHVYPFGWFGVLVEAPPYSPELIYAHHERGFSLVSTRSADVQRLYLQCNPDDDADHWPDSRIWSELDTRVAMPSGERLRRGRIVQKGVIQMRSFVVEPMRYGTLFLAGDAAHIVPPTGAKGLNLAIADVKVLADALTSRYASGSDEALDRYSDIALDRVWAAQHFSWWMTSMLHRFNDHDSLQRRLQRAQLRELMQSRALQTALAERYVGLPLANVTPEGAPTRAPCKAAAGRAPTAAHQA